MAVTATNSAQIAGTRLYPVEDGGKLRIAYFDVTQGVAAGDIASTMELCKLPIGRIRILPLSSRVQCSAWGAARTLGIGFRAYTDSNQAAVAEDAAALVAALDVSAAVTVAISATLLKWDIFSFSGVTVFAKVAGGTIPAAATLKGYIVYTDDN